MGLDSVELVMAIEEEFGISVPDEAAVEMRRVGDLVRFVALATDVPADGESGRRGWIDRRFGEVIGREVSDLPESTRVVDLLDAGCEKRQWGALGGVLPELVIPPWTRWCIPVGLLLVGGLVIYFSLPVEGIFFNGVFVLLLFAVLPYSAFAVCCFLARKIPELELTVGELLGKGQEESRLDFVEGRVKQIVAEQLGVELSIVENDSLFIEDLGME